MAKYKLALIGKNISHSKSPEIYNKLLNNQVEYHLLDYPSINEIPEMDFFSKNFDGRLHIKNFSLIKWNL